jgi:hypothetical protein
MCNEKTKTVGEVWVQGELMLSFKRTFIDIMLQSWGGFMCCSGAGCPEGGT